MYRYTSLPSAVVFVVVMLIMCLGGVGCQPDIPDQVRKEMAILPEAIDYNYHVKPILSDRCFACHGPDAAKRAAGLRLDQEENAYAALTSGNGHAIVPGKLSSSAMARRILSDDPEIQMPPPKSNLRLNAKEKAILLKWIEQGAAYKPHWAFITPEKATVPRAGEGWANNEIDRFVARKLKSMNITPAPQAKREYLIRRLFFDLTGLPPTLNDLNKWMAAPQNTYYEALVDSLLNTSAYGERMAAHWLDVARFADSEGYLDDFHHTFWPYRDWVIKAFNENMPYNQFITWQLAGDLIPEADQSSVLATAFNRNHKQNSEGGIIPEEFRVEYVADRTQTLGAAFLGLTLNCARCHDHKYDPISQENYYEFFAFFNSTIERGDGIFSQNALEYGQNVPNELSMNAGPVLALESDEVKEIRNYLSHTIATTEQKLDSLSQLAAIPQDLDVDRKLLNKRIQEILEGSTVSWLSFEHMEGGADVDKVRGNTPPRYSDNQTIASAEGVHGRAVQSHAMGKYIADGKQAQFERSDPFTISFWLYTPEFFPEAHVMYNGNNRIQGYRGWDITLDSNRVHFRLNHAHPYQSIDIRTAGPIPEKEWVHFVWTYDGSGSAEGMRLYLNGQPLTFQVERDYLYRSTIPYPDTRGTVYVNYQGIIIGNRHYDQDFSGGRLDEVRILNREAGDLIAAFLYDPESIHDATTQATLKEFHDLHLDKQQQALRKKIQKLRQKDVMAIDTVQEIMVMGDWSNERPTFILERGVYNQRGERVERDVPGSILPWPESYPRNRLGLAQWLTHPDHPLTSRVAVNQLWYLMFGTGLVETVEDLGNQGALPTHPELLDWLAVDFRENGWDVKRTLRLMVTSATYKQSSRIRKELQAIDPDNKWLARSPRYRRSAEMIRDNVLAASGLLDRQIGGPSAFPYQPPGLWREVMAHGFFPEYQEDKDGLYRRSIYTFWKRNMPPPSMLIFDASSRAECEVRRKRSSTPLQALVLLNDPQILEGCRVLAEEVMQATPDLSLRLEQIFKSFTSRAPVHNEMNLLSQLYEEELQYFQQHPEAAHSYLSTGYRPYPSELDPAELAALARVSGTVLNTTEGYYKN